jgi:hypothetical protein
MTMSQRYYRITIEGRLSDRFSAAFDGLRLEPGPNRTVLSGVCVDSSALYGVLDRVRDLGLDLIALESTPVSPPGPAPSGQRQGPPAHEVGDHPS